MKTITLTLLVIINFSFAQTSSFVEKQLIIKLSQSEYDRAQINLVGSTFGIESLDYLNTQKQVSSVRQIGQHKFTRTFLLTFAQDYSMESLTEEYKNLGIFEYATPNYYGKAAGHESVNSGIIPSDTRFNRQWSFYNIGAGQLGIGPSTPVADADVDMELAWDIQTGDPNMIIAVVDGGARLTHPDFASRIWTNSAETANGVDDDSNGLIDDLNGWDYFFNDNNPTDERGHGSNVGGIIGSIADNGNLYAGANWNSKIMVLKCLDYDLNATYEGVANAVYYAVDHGAKIINLSLGFSPASPVLEDFVIYAENQGAIITAAMMNFNNNTTYYPAGYSLTHSNVIACGATSPNDYRTAPFDWSAASGSNFGSHINVAAPGSYIYNLTYNSDTTFTTYWSGTSMATPLVASIASLVWAEAPSLTPAEVRNIIQNSAQDQVGNPTEDTPGFDMYMGYGRANSHQAVLAAQALARDQFDSAAAQEFTMINPVQNTLQIFSKGFYAGAYEVTVKAMDGKSLYNDDAMIKPGKNDINFDFPAGHYIVTLKSSKYSKIFKVVKQ